MIEVTDKMVAAAFVSLRKFYAIEDASINDMRVALEAAYAAREPAAKDAEIARLREALKPFAVIADEIQPIIRDDQKTGMYWALPTAGDFRRARDILTRRGVKL